MFRPSPFKNVSLELTYLYFFRKTLVAPLPVLIKNWIIKVRKTLPACVSIKLNQETICAHIDLLYCYSKGDYLC